MSIKKTGTLLEPQKSKGVTLKQQEAFLKKKAEYEQLSLDELKELYNGPKKPGGSYLEALLYVVNDKLQELKEAHIQEAIESEKQTRLELEEEKSDEKVD